MKKLLIVLSLVLLLTGCAKQEISGEVTSVTPRGYYMELSILGRKQTVLVDRETHIYSFSDEIPSEQLLTGNLRAPQITAYDLKWTAEGYVADSICVESILLPEPYILQDGTPLNIRKQYFQTCYETEDGIVILREEQPVGPSNVQAGSLPSLDQLSPDAQKGICSYYEEQGLLYDLDAELERAWQRFGTTEEKALFQAHLLSQTIVPIGANKSLIHYATITTLPIDGIHIQEVRRSATFDQNTGERISTEDLFQCPPDEIGEAVITAAKIPDQTVTSEMIHAFRPEYLMFESYALEVHFPEGSLPENKGAYIVCVKYEDLTGLLHPWAIPDKQS